MNNIARYFSLLLPGLLFAFIAVGTAYAEDTQATRLLIKRNAEFDKEIIQVSESVDIYREMIWGLMDMYMTTISNKMNEVMKVLTIMASIFIPLTFMAGIYGMNFDNMPELHFKYSYYYLLGVMVVVFFGMIWYRRSLPSANEGEQN